MSLTQKSKKAAAQLSIDDIDGLVLEIADFQNTCDQIRADIASLYRDLDARLAPLKLAAQPGIERLQTTLDAVDQSLGERWDIVEAWAQAHKADRFAEPRSLKLLGGVIGFRLSPPKLGAIKGCTLSMCAHALRLRRWGREFLHPAKIDHEAVLRNRARFQADPRRLLAVGLQITQEDVFYIEPAASGSDAHGKEAA